MPPADPRVPAEGSIDPRLVLPASKEEQQLEHEFLQKFLTLADIALGVPQRSQNKKIA